MNIGILISGRGSNMVALVDAVASGGIPDSEVAVVISDKADAPGLEKARERGVETVVVERRGRPRVEHDAEIIVELKERGVELVCLAGYMRLLSPEFVQAFPNRIVNIHPSLLPAFPGLDAQKQALEACVKITGCTVHFVDKHLDHGPVILQREVQVLEDDTVKSLAARILEREHEAYVDAVRRIATGRLPNPKLDTYSEDRRKLAEILDIGLESSMRGEGISLVEALRRTDYENRRQRFSAADLQSIIRENSYYVTEWIQYSEDKRTEGGWWVIEEPPGIGNLKSREEMSFSSIDQAIAEYVVRELDFWAGVN